MTLQVSFPVSTVYIRSTIVAERRYQRAPYAAASVLPMISVRLPTLRRERASASCLLRPCGAMVEIADAELRPFASLRSMGAAGPTLRGKALVLAVFSVYPTAPAARRAGRAASCAPGASPVDGAATLVALPGTGHRGPSPAALLPGRLLRSAGRARGDLLNRLRSSGLHGLSGPGRG